MFELTHRKSPHPLRSLTAYSQILSNMRVCLCHTLLQAPTCASLFSLSFLQNLDRIWISLNFCDRSSELTHIRYLLQTCAPHPIGSLERRIQLTRKRWRLPLGRICRRCMFVYCGSNCARQSFLTHNERFPTHKPGCEHSEIVWYVLSFSHIMSFEEVVQNPDLGKIKGSHVGFRICLRRFRPSLTGPLTRHGEWLSHLNLFKVQNNVGHAVSPWWGCAQTHNVFPHVIIYEYRNKYYPDTGHICSCPFKMQTHGVFDAVLRL